MARTEQEGSARQNYAEKFAADIIEGLKDGTAPWIRPWKAGEFVPPLNPVSGTKYKGANYMALASRGFADPRWMTLKQANECGGRIKKGEKSRQVVYWQFTRKEAMLDTAGNPVLGADGKAVTEEVRLDRPIMSVANVFHASQVDGVPPWKAPENPAWDVAARAEAILNNSGAVIKYDQRNRAFYHPREDSIHLPPREQFPSAEGFYSTSLHELAHWTGHEQRMNRSFGGVFGSENYAREELRAEIASWMVSMELGLPHEPGQHLSYVQSWIKDLEQDPYEIIRACQDAEKIKTLVLGYEQHKAVEKAPELAAMPVEADLETARARLNTLSDVAEAAHEKWTGAMHHLDEVHEKNASAGKVEEAWQRYESSRDEKDAAWRATKTQYKVVEAMEAQQKRQKTQRVYLAVPFSEKNRAKALGARWDGDQKSWYAPAGSELAPFARWMPEKTLQAVAAMSPEAEFAERLKEAGLDLKGALPVMDGQLHRVPLVDRPHGRDGAYRGNLDGRPAGWLQNHVTGEVDTWKFSGHKLDPQDIARLREEAQAKQEAEQLQRQQGYALAAKRCQARWERAAWATGAEDYLQTKGVPAFGLKVDDLGRVLVPGRDAEGNLRTVQTITPDAKLFERGSQKSGAFHVIDPENTLGQGPLFIAEGYATAASVHMATGQPVAVAFDAGNMLHVAKALREKFPEQPIALMADNDLANPANPGINKAILAAEAVGGSVYAPTFSAEETAAKLTDWNDLHQKHGLQALHQQLDFLRPLHQAKGKDIAVAQEEQQEKQKVTPAPSKSASRRKNPIVREAPGDELEI